METESILRDLLWKAVIKGRKYLDSNSSKLPEITQLHLECLQETVTALKTYTKATIGEYVEIIMRDLEVCLAYALEVKAEAKLEAAQSENASSITNTRMLDSSLSGREICLDHTLITPCTTVKSVTCNKETYIRLVISNNSPINIIGAAAAKRLGIQVPSEKKLRLRGILGGRFSATYEEFALLVTVLDGPPFPISVHIVDDYSIDLPALNYKDFKKIHPYLSNQVVADMGHDRPIELLLGARHCFAFINGNVNKEQFKVKPGWNVLDGSFGWMVYGGIRHEKKRLFGSLSFVYDNEIYENSD